jgi:GntR family transcriptional regulator/MocR family aminotransferase
MDLAITLDPNNASPLQRQLADRLREAILDGRLRPGQRLPSSRGLAHLLQVSRNTVIGAYEQLASEGYLQAEGGSGTCVSRALPEECLNLPTHGGSEQIRRAVPGLSAYGTSLDDAEPLEVPMVRTRISFRYAQPDLDHVPLRQWSRLWVRHCRSREPFDYAPDGQGYPPLRAAIADYLARARAVRCTPAQVIIVNGAQQGLDLAVRVLVGTGDRVVCEEPCFPDARRMLLAQGARLHPVPVDGEGIRTDQLPTQTGEPFKLVYLTPSHQFPTGATLSLTRRLALLRWAETRGAYILEDDFGNEFRYDGRPIPALQGLDRGQSVLYVGGFSAALFPALRLGYLVVPADLAHVFARAKLLADRQAPLIEQHVLTDFLVEGHLERHLRRMRILYDTRRKALLEALAQHLGDRVEIRGEHAGMHLHIRLASHLDDEEILERSARLGVGLSSTRPCYRGTPVRGEFLLGYAAVSPEAIREGIAILAGVLD